VCNNRQTDVGREGPRGVFIGVGANLLRGYSLNPTSLIEPLHKPAPLNRDILNYHITLLFSLLSGREEYKASRFCKKRINSSPRMNCTQIGPGLTLPPPLKELHRSNIPPLDYDDSGTS
jgi:hypothetical protein